MEMMMEDFIKKFKDAPEYCPITGLCKCESYGFEDNVVYITNPAYDAYTLPIYDEESQEFYRTHYDMDAETKDEEWLCSLDDLRYREDFEEIKKFYNIIE